MARELTEVGVVGLGTMGAGIAEVLAQDRGIDCVTVDYAVLKGTDDPSQRLF